MKVSFIDLKKQYGKIRKETEREVGKVLASGWYTSGKKVENFEKKFADFCGTKYAVGVNNGTSALVVALMALGVKRGDEVITQPNTFVATVEAILFIGAKPVLADINPGTYNLDIKKLERAITRKTKIILPVHLFGQPSEMDSILKLAKKHKLCVVEDCAQAHGAAIEGKKAGNFGDIGCFSFYPTKVLGAFGEGGAVVTNSWQLSQKMRQIRAHGSDKKYYHSEVGFNFRLEEIQGALLALKLKYLNQWIKLRQEKARIYDELLQGTKVVIPPQEGVYYVYVIRTKKRDEVQKYLKKQGIETMIHYPLPIHLQKGYKLLGYKGGDFPEAEKACREILSLPLYPEITLKQQKYVAQKIKEFYSL